MLGQTEPPTTNPQVLQANSILQNFFCLPFDAGMTLRLIKSSTAFMLARTHQHPHSQYCEVYICLNLQRAKNPVSLDSCLRLKQPLDSSRQHPNPSPCCNHCPRKCRRLLTAIQPIRTPPPPPRMSAQTTLRFNSATTIQPKASIVLSAFLARRSRKFSCCVYSAFDPGSIFGVHTSHKLPKPASFTEKSLLAPHSVRKQTVAPQASC